MLSWQRHLAIMLAAWLCGVAGARAQEAALIGYVELVDRDRPDAGGVTVVGFRSLLPEVVDGPLAFAFRRQFLSDRICIFAETYDSKYRFYALYDLSSDRRTDFQLKIPPDTELEARLRAERPENLAILAFQSTKCPQPDPAGLTIPLMPELETGEVVRIVSGDRGPENRTLVLMLAVSGQLADGGTHLDGHNVQCSARNDPDGTIVVYNNVCRATPSEDHVPGEIYLTIAVSPRTTPRDPRFPLRD